MVWQFQHASPSTQGEGTDETQIAIPTMRATSRKYKPVIFMGTSVGAPKGARLWLAGRGLRILDDVCVFGGVQIRVTHDSSFPMFMSSLRVHLIQMNQMTKNTIRRTVSSIELPSLDSVLCERTGNLLTPFCDGETIANVRNSLEACALTVQEVHGADQDCRL